MSDEPIRLTQTVKCAGCASKIPPKILYQALAGISWPTAPEVLVGFDEADDAGVYKISEDRALVATTDFFTPVVDDPYDYGRIAATNALSDIYAMGARPLFALNIVCFPRELPPDILKEVLRGGADVARAAGIVVIGGHSVEAPEMKYGMAVIGEAHPKDILEIRGARVGSVLVLTKALGTGILNTAVKRAEVPKATYDTLIASMTRLNRDAAKCMAEFECYGCTDVTGFGLAGHGMEMAKASRVELVISTAKLPLLPGLADAVAQGCVTRGDRTNREYTEGRVTMDEKVSQLLQHVVFDPQTSGGLLISVRADQAEALVARLREAGDTAAAIVGDVRAHASGCLRFIP